MAPTIQDGQKGRDQERKQSSVHRATGKADFVCRVKYNNTLPDIPFDAKFIAYPFETNRFVQYKPTSLEKNYKHELLADVDLGVSIDLIDPQAYTVGLNATLDPADERLLEEDAVALPDQKRTRQHNRHVSWLRKTEYISTEYNRSQTSNEMAETKVGFSIKKKFQGADIYKDRESQISAIESTFGAAQRPIHRHPSKSNVTPVEVLPVFPDFQMWSQPCAHVVFDTDPAPRGRSGPAQAEEMSQAMIRGMVDASGDQFVAYFLPSQETLRKRKRDQSDGADFVDEEEYEYKMAREYNWNVKNKATKGYEENYFFVFHEGEGVFYNELVTRVRLSKRRAQGGAGGVRSAVSKLVVKHREMNENETKAQHMRLAQLEATTAEEEEEEEEEEEKTEEDADWNDIVGPDDDDDDEDAASKDDNEDNKDAEDDEEEESDKEKEDNDDEDEEEEEEEEKASSEGESSPAESESEGEDDE